MAVVVAALESSVSELRWKGKPEDGKVERGYDGREEDACIRTSRVGLHNHTVSLERLENVSIYICIC